MNGVIINPDPKSDSPRRRFYNNSIKLLAIWRHFGQFVAVFLMRMRTNGYLYASDENSDITIRSAIPSFPTGRDILAI